jgi:hypothetical protein
MALFQPSTKAVSAVCQEIADTVGASGDGEMTTRAGRSLFAAMEHFNNRANWDFLRTESAPIRVFAPFTVSGITASAGQSSALAPVGHGLLPDDFLMCSGFALGTRISATASGSFGFYGQVSGFTSGNTVVSATINRDMYDLPSDFKASYGARLHNSNVELRYVNRRTYDRSMYNEYTTSTPYWYDLFMVGNRGKIRLLTPPVAEDDLQLRYYRRMTIPTTTATGDAIDITQDYELYLISWAKWHFLTDKGEGRSDQAKTWFALGNDGLVTMLRDQTRIPDDGLMLVPGHFQFGTIGDNTTRWLPWEY